MCGRLNGLVHRRGDPAFRRVSVETRVLARLQQQGSCLLPDLAETLRPEGSVECQSEARVVARLQEHRGRGRDRSVLRDAVQRAVDDELRRRLVPSMVIFVDSFLVVYIVSLTAQKTAVH